jgi:hypothetical protein
MAAFAEEVAEVVNFGEALEFKPLIEGYDRMLLTISGPCNYFLERSFREGENPFFKLDETTIDGRYRFDLVVIPRIDGEIVEILKKARRAGDDNVPNQLCRDGKLPGAPASQAHGFVVERSRILLDFETQEERLVKSDRGGNLAASLSGGSDLAGGGAAFPAKDQVIPDDLIVIGSACIGFDCVNGEVFSFDTIRLKENNLRIKFDDTSTINAFPRNDWQITANDSANGGLSKFSIDDTTNGRTPFTIEANARSHSLYVDDGGRIGNRTSTPSVEFHSIDGDTPTLRLQQDGSSGFAPQTWDVAGNETNFFVRDVTNGSTLPFRIQPGAPSSAIFIESSTGDVGLGTSSPQDSLHIQTTNSASDNATIRYVNGDGPLNVPDYVFAPDYDLMTLDELETFVTVNRHLPNVPSAAEMETEGVNMTKLQFSLLEKVEELTLYTLELKKELEALKLQNAELASAQEAAAGR